MTRPSTRPAFTLVELLVVMALIATLAAITTGAVFRVQAAQRKSFTEATLQKVDSLLLQKLKTIQEQIKDYRKSNPPAYTAAMSMAGNDQNIAEAILMYAHTKNQLPMSFNEARTPTIVTINGSTLALPVSPVFAAIPAAGGGSQEAAACLYLALSQLGNTGLEQQIGEVTIGGSTFKCYVDAYGEPVVFNRLAFNGDNGELDNPPFVKSGIAFDPFYPKLNPQAAGTYRNLATDLGTANANTLWDAITTNMPNWAAVPGQRNGAVPAAYPGLKNHTTAAISSGPDKDLLTYGLYSGDNIVSYRLRKEGAKGD